MSNEIKAGDVVTLKVGGRRLTVAHVSTTNAPRPVVCVWEYEGRFHEQGFAATSLQLATEVEPTSAQRSRDLEILEQLRKDGVITQDTFLVACDALPDGSK